MPTANINFGIYFVEHFILKESVVFWIKSYDQESFPLLKVLRIELEKTAINSMTMKREHNPPVKV